MIDALHAHLEALYRRTDAAARLQHDPVAFVHRYTRTDDREIAALLSSGLAFGRVDLFTPALRRLFDAMDDHGGPARFLHNLDPRAPAPWGPWRYRWVDGADVLTLLCAVRRALGDRPLQSALPTHGPLQQRLAAATALLRDAARTELGTADLPRGVATFLPDAAAGSACKRWNLMLRWMVRPPTEGVDLGLWTTLGPADLLIPLDTHVGRIAVFLGLTQRTDATWRTAQQITDRLAAYDPQDPVRFDFAIAHLGISGACLGHRDPQACAACPLDPVCIAPA